VIAAIIICILLVFQYLKIEKLINIIQIIKEKVDYDIDFWIDYNLKDNEECIIQKGIDSNGAKRPIGIMIKKHLLEN